LPAQLLLLLLAAAACVGVQVAAVVDPVTGPQARQLLGVLVTRPAVVKYLQGYPGLSCLHGPLLLPLLLLQHEQLPSGCGHGSVWPLAPC
jgi:hypothetical protein